MSILAGKKVIIIGDRDGIPGMAIEACAESAGAEVVFSSTEVFLNGVLRLNRRWCNGSGKSEAG